MRARRDDALEDDHEESLGVIEDHCACQGIGVLQEVPSKSEKKGRGANRGAKARTANLPGCHMRSQFLASSLDHLFYHSTLLYFLGRRTLASDPGTDARPLLPRTTEERAPKSKRQPRARTMIRYDSKYFFRVIFRCVLDGEAAISVTPPRQLIPLSPRALPPRPGSQGGTARCSRTAGRECSSRCSGRRWSPCSRRRSICPSWTGQ